MASGLVAGAAGGAYSQRCAYDLRMETHELQIKGWQAEGFRVAVLGDMHLNSQTETRRAERAVAAAVTAKTDLIVVVGDFIDASGPKVLPNIQKALSGLASAKCPCVGVMGNHDYWTRKPALVIQELQKSPLKLLRNETAEVDGVTIIGIDDAIAGRDKYDFFPQGSISASSIALIHEPDVNDRIPDHASIQISGHSHGGQICLPFGIPIHTPHGAKIYKTGFYPEPRVPVFVTRGVGTTGPNYRLFCPPEVAILTLRAA